MVAALLSRLRPLLGLAIISLLGALLLLALSAGIFWRQNRPTGLQTMQEVHIQPGMNARSIGRLLQRQGLIRSSAIFALTVRLQGLQHRLEAGTYHLDGTRSTVAMARQLLEAPVRTRRITIPEGLTRQEVAGLLSRSGLVDSTRFLAFTADAALLGRRGIDAPTLEGYLFPETYFFDVETTESAAIERMVDEFHAVFADSLRHRLTDIGLSLHEAVTLASIIEREAMAQEERPIISGVFQRRLRLQRRLESCATVEYALGVHKKWLTNADLQVDSPYNTYRHRGLPPGPIGNPGRASLLATLYPADTDYLYFVARGDGTHIFSRTNSEHEKAKQAVRRQQRRSRSQAGGE